LKDFFIWSIYNVLFAVGYTLMLPKFILRMRRRGGYRHNFMQRFGIYNTEITGKLADTGRVWIHAVSVGEIFVALHFIEEMRSMNPALKFILSTTTSTGYAQAAAKLNHEDILIYFPTDFPFIVRKVIRKLNPAALILTECELWPNLLRHLNRNNIPIFVINGRISESSFRGYSKIKPFFRRAADWVTLFLVQSRLDATRLTALGAKSEKVIVEGSAKYDVAVPDPDSSEAARRIIHAAGLQPERPLLVAGSTWPGEETIMLDIFEQLRQKVPDVQLILVPRHMERREEVENLLKSRNIHYIKRTDMAGATATKPEQNDILLADTTGELKNYYSIATVVFVGKSMEDNFGGQNPIEPAMFAKPIVVGPHMENFPGVMDDFLAARALLQVATPAELKAAIEKLFADAELRRELGGCAGRLVASKRGVVKRSVERILPIIARQISG